MRPLLPLLFLIACADEAAPPAETSEQQPLADGGAEAAPRPDAAPVIVEGFGLLSLNLHCLKTDGTAFKTNVDRFAAVARAVKDEDVRVIAAQEVCKRPGEDAEKMLLAALKTETGSAWSASWAPAHRAWEGTPDEAEEGLAVFVRGQARPEPALIYRAQTPLLRVMVGVKLPEAMGGHHVYSVHFDHQNAPVRAAQARETANAAMVDAELDAVVAGDFNDRAGGVAHGALLASGFRDLSGTRGIDHVMVHRAAPLAAASAKVLFEDVRVSDHPGVLVKLTPAAAPEVAVSKLAAKAELGDHWLSVRGDLAPLSWTVGIPARLRDGEWRVLLTEPKGPFRFKFLRDDQVWQKGADVSGAPGAETRVAPEF